MSKLVTEETAASPDIEADVEAAILLCDGDVRAALRATLVANAYLDAELERVIEMVSAGYGRGRVRAARKKKVGK